MVLALLALSFEIAQHVPYLLRLRNIRAPDLSVVKPVLLGFDRSERITRERRWCLRHGNASTNFAHLQRDLRPRISTR